MIDKVVSNKPFPNTYEVLKIVFPEQQNNRTTEIIHSAANSRLRIWAENAHLLEPDLIEWIDHIPDGKILYDLGACTGIFSLSAAINNKNVYSFEPDAQNFSALELNKYFNRNAIRGTLQTFNCALSSETKIEKLFQKFYGAGEHVKILSQPRTRNEDEIFQSEYIQNVMSFSLDEFVNIFSIPAPNYLKIDVDGSELNVINGMRSCLKSTNLQSIFIELDESTPHHKTVIDIVCQNGFSLSKKNPVWQVKGGYVENLFNYEFNR